MVSDHDVGLLFFPNNIDIVTVFLDTHTSLECTVEMTIHVCNNSTVIPEALIYCILTDYRDYNIAHVI